MASSSFTHCGYSNSNFSLSATFLVSTWTRNPDSSSTLYCAFQTFFELDFSVLPSWPALVWLRSRSNVSIHSTVIRSFYTTCRRFAQVGCSEYLSSGSFRSLKTNSSLWSVQYGGLDINTSYTSRVIFTVQVLSLRSHVWINFSPICNKNNLICNWHK